MSDSESSSDDDIAKLMSKAKQQTMRQQQRAQDSASEDDDDDDSSVEAISASKTAAYSKSPLEAFNVSQKAAATFGDSSSDEDDDDDDKDCKPISAPAPAKRLVDPRKITVSVKKISDDMSINNSHQDFKPKASQDVKPRANQDKDIIEIVSSNEKPLYLSSSDEDERRQRRRGAFKSNKQMQALEAAQIELSKAQRYKSTKQVASPSLSPSKRTRVAVEKFTLTAECKLMLHGSLQSHKTVQLRVLSSTLLSQIHEVLLKACDLTRNTAVVSTLSCNDRVIGKTAAALSKTLLTVCPTIKSGSALHATLHLTGLTASAKDIAREVHETDEKKFGKSIRICLRRTVDRKDDREEWSIRQREPFINLMTKYSEKHLIKVVFKFDGQVLGPDTSPKDHDMEHEDLIDVVVMN